MEGIQLRVKSAVDKMIDDIDVKYLRQLQRKMFLCSANCCENSALSRDELEGCIDRCNISLKGAQMTLENELGNLQGQLSRCAMTCYDKLTQKYGPEVKNYSNSQMEEFNNKLNECISRCADDHIKLLPGIKERFEKTLK
uniref:Protein FAM136A n=1 Tax=Syphacia muris TaxID=451379 RepID=A0A0N5AR19_9BILA